MPYIPRERRVELGPDAKKLARKLRNGGELNFAITTMLLEFLPDNPRYSDFSGVLGDVVSAMLELYRRRIADYENQKCALNGDVY